ncbi:SAM-dependent methyltransferase [Salinifilum aidingensis]
MQPTGREPLIGDENTPNAARLYDYYLGGAHNFEADRSKAHELMELWPNVVPVARFNRDFVRRVVQHALRAGITQFLDLGSGVPTVGNVHEIARAQVPHARVVYDDHESVAFNYSTLLLDEHGYPRDEVAVVDRDLRDAEAVLSDPRTLRALDFEQPICVLMVAVLHFVSPADDPAGIIDRYSVRLPPGSWLALTHIANDEAPDEQARAVDRFAAAYQDTSNPLFVRDRAEILPWFDGFTVLDPGVTFIPDWRPDAALDHPTEARRLAWCGVGRKDD